MDKDTGLSRDQALELLETLPQEHMLLLIQQHHAMREVFIMFAQIEYPIAASGETLVDREDWDSLKEYAALLALQKHTEVLR